MKFRTKTDFSAIAKSKGGELLTEYVGTHKYLTLRCHLGHVWNAIPSSVKRGHWCRKCRFLKILEKFDYYELARSRGGELLSKKYLGGRVRLKWRCSLGHTWEAMPRQVKAGTWCRKCSVLNKLDKSDFHQLARQRGGELLTEKYLGQRILHTWRCKEGHVWKAKPADIKRGWCRKCVHLKLKDTTDFYEIAKSRGGDLLSKSYVNSKTNMLWRCKLGHEWRAPSDRIKKGTWCRICANLSRRKDAPEKINDSIVRELKNNSKGSLRREAEALARQLKKKGITFKKNI